jgi:Tol biopolymer transport system component
MAYVTDSNSEQRDVYFKPVSGTRTTRLTFDLADDLFPRVSPDGRQVAFCSNRHGNWDILVVSVDRPSAVMQVTMGPEDEIHPSWSGDGTKLVYCASPRRGEWELRIADLRSGAQTTLGPGIFPDWNPVDNRIAFQFPKARPGEGWSGIWTVDAMGEGGPTQLVSAEFFDDGQWGAINPAWSPDGEWIAFSTVHQSPVAVWEKRLFEADDIWLVRADGSKVTVRITDSPEPEWHPAWGGRGARQRLFFTRREGGRQTIWSVQPILFPFAASPDGAAASAGR